MYPPDIRDWPSPRTFSLTDAASMIEQLIPFVNQQFFGGSPPNTIQNLLHTVTTDFNS
jgi:hypothetical protein